MTKIEQGGPIQGFVIRLPRRSPAKAGASTFIRHLSFVLCHW
jgi:hypothetical protein